MQTYPWSTCNRVIGQNESCSSSLRWEVLQDGVTIYQAQLTKKLKKKIKISVSCDKWETQLLNCRKHSPLISFPLCCSQVGARNTGWGTDWLLEQQDQTRGLLAPDAPSSALVFLCRCRQWCKQILPPLGGRSPQTSYSPTEKCEHGEQQGGGVVQSEALRQRYLRSQKHSSCANQL